MADPWAVQSVDPDGADGWGIASVERTPPKSVPKRSLWGEAAGFMANVNRGLLIGDELAAGASALVNATTGKGPQGFRANMAAQRRVEDDYRADRPKAAALGIGTGNAISALVPVGQSGALAAQATRGINMARGATTSALSGAAYALGDRGTAQERLKAASNPAMLATSAALGAGMSALAPAVKKVKPAKVDPDVALLNREGVSLTPGQMRGGVARAAEDNATSLPILGTSIADRRTEGFDSFDRALINRTLKPIGEALPDGMTGTEAVKYAGDKLSKGYETAIPGRVIRADSGFADDVRQVFDGIDTLTPQATERLADILDKRITSRLPQNGKMDGELYKLIQSELDFEVNRFSGATDPDMRAVGDAIQGVQSALENAARRQDPSFAARIEALDRGWAELARIEAAAAKSTDLSGRFTPAHYRQSLVAGDNRVRRRGVARGEAMSQDLAGAALRVLPSKVPDSGTAGRGMWGILASAPGAALGAMTGGGVGALAGIGGTAAGLSALSKAAYSPRAIDAANQALSAKVGSAAQSQALNDLKAMAANSPEARRVLNTVLTRLGVSVGAGAAAGWAPAGLESVEVGGKTYWPDGRITDAQR